MNLHDLIRLCIVTSYEIPTEKLVTEQMIRSGPAYGQLSTTDLRIAIEELSQQRALTDVYHHAVELCRPVISACTFTDGEVAIGPQGLMALNTLIRWISLDLIVLLACADQLDALTDCPVWPLFPRFGSRHLRTMLTRGVGDMHMHEMAMRQPEDLWRRLVIGEVRWEHVTQRNQHLFDPWPLLPSPTGFAADLASALTYARARHAALVANPRAPDAVVQFRNAERQHVFEIVKRIRHGETKPPDRRYLLTKNTLWRLVRQPDDGVAPGLDAFAARWYPAVPKSDRDMVSRLSRPNRRPPRAYLLRELGVPMQTLAETPHLRRVELRSTPQRREVDYAKWATIHEELLPTHFGWHQAARPAALQATESSPPSQRPAIAMRLAVHFRRSLSKKVDERGEALLNFDREAAALMEFRCRFPEQACRVARLDMAVAEREMGCRTVGFVYRTLRGTASRDCHAAFAERHAPRIQALAPQLRAKHLTLARMGATCHAGEDFGCQFSGLREIADAIYALGLRDGDSIGHGLALGWDPIVFFKRFGHRARLRTGEHFDSLLWAYTEICLDEAGARWRLEVESRLSQLFYAIHPDCKLAITADFWLSLRRAQLRFPLVPVKAARAEIVQLVEAEFTDSAVFARRGQVVPDKYFQGYPQLLELISWLQQRLIATVSARGIVIEVHPSSNMRVGGTKDPGEMPTVALLENERLVCAIGTDDPGVFATNVEYEYALMEEALIRKNNWPRHRAIALLDRARRASLEAIYWPDYEPLHT